MRRNWQAVDWNLLRERAAELDTENGACGGFLIRLNRGLRTRTTHWHKVVTDEFVSIMGNHAMQITHMRFIAVSSAWLLACSFALSQASTPVISPEVHSDSSVTFRFLDPQAPEVLLEMDGAKPVKMQKDHSGIWSTTTARLAPDYYGYHFQIGSVGVVDPSNPVLLPNLLQNESVVHVPGPTSLPWELTDKPHGVLHHHFYKSLVTGEQRDFYVYTPPGYTPGSKTLYPVLYLLHGYGQLTSSWIQTGLANVIFDHLIDEGKAEPMIVVMPLSNGGAEIIAGGHEAFMNDALRIKNFDKFTKDLFTEVIPQVERDYRVKKDRNARAIAGLSMGGAESLHTGLNHLDEFAWIGAFSSGGMLQRFGEEFPDLSVSTNARLRLLWIACGTGDVWINLNRDFNKWLDAKSVKHTYVETSGEHTWMVWRRNLANFAPLLFH